MRTRHPADSCPLICSWPLIRARHTSPRRQPRWWTDECFRAQCSLAHIPSLWLSKTELAFLSDACSFTAWCDVHFVHIGDRSPTILLPFSTLVAQEHGASFVEDQHCQPKRGGLASPSQCRAIFRGSLFEHRIYVGIALLTCGKLDEAQGGPRLGAGSSVDCLGDVLRFRQETHFSCLRRTSGRLSHTCSLDTGWRDGCAEADSRAPPRTPGRRHPVGSLMALLFRPRHIPTCSVPPW